jgi:UDP-glucose 4-epimerase
MKKILITGVAGFIGSHIAKRFLKESYAVVGIDDLSGGKLENIPEGIEFIKGDLADQQTILKIPTGCELILHLAGQSSGEVSFDNPVADLEKNVVSTLNLIQYGLKEGVKKFVYASSMSVYGNVADEPVKENVIASPLSCYGVGKLTSEGYLKVYQNNLPFAIMRMFNVYGPGQDLSNLRQGMVSIYLAQALNNRKIIVKGGLERYRDFIYIDDVVEAWFRIATTPGIENTTVNIGTGKRTTIHELLKKICDCIPDAQFFLQDPTPGDQNGIYADTKVLYNATGMQNFVPLEKGLQHFYEWAKNIASR